MAGVAEGPATNDQLGNRAADPAAAAASPVAPSPAAAAPRMANRAARQGFRRHLLLFGVLVTVGFELLTVVVRFGTGVSAVEFNKKAPLLLQIHHMFWSLPLFAAAAFTMRGLPRVTGALIGIGLGFIASDLVHHFVVLPILVGNTGWHWP